MKYGLHRQGFLLLAAGLIVFSGVSAWSQAPSSQLVVAPDLAQRIAQFKPVKMPFDSRGLTDREKRMVDKLVDASGLLDCIYWRQSDPEGLKLYLSLANSKNPRDRMLREYLKINGGRFDLIDDNKPFVGTQPISPGRGFFPWGMTLDEFNAYVTAHPDQKAALYSPYTIVRRKGDALEAIPYHVAYRTFVVPMAADLREAAALSDDPAFAKFLRVRADALLTDNYYKSDIIWVDLESPKFDVVFAPYEVYLDGLLGVKTSYGASVMIRDDAESKKVEVFQQYVPELQESLALPAADLPSKHGKQSPMEVVNAIYRAGDLLHGYQAVADNLPNDPRIHEEKGSKKIFWKNFMDARVNYIISAARPATDAFRSGEVGQQRGTDGFCDFARDFAWARSILRARGRRQDRRRRSNRPAIFLTRGIQGGRDEHARCEMAGRERRDSEKQTRRNLRLLSGGDVSHDPIRHRGGTWTGVDDAAQLSHRAGRDSTRSHNRPL
jgi:hypothetical protein